LFDGFNGNGAALGFAHHADEAGFGQHHLGKAIHAGGSGWACGPDGFTFDGVHGAYVVDHAVGEVHGQFFTFGEHGLDTFVGSIASGQHFAVQKQGLTWFPAGDFFFGQGVEVDFFAFDVVWCPLHVWPQIKAWWV
ncbi:MAG: hypothetical protein RL171_539, partial [Pseudomonadota bacterium]